MRARFGVGGGGRGGGGVGGRWWAGPGWEGWEKAARGLSSPRPFPTRTPSPPKRPTPGSLILETDPSTIAQRASMAGAEGDVPLAEQTLSKVAAMAKEQIARSLLK